MRRALALGAFVTLCTAVALAEDFLPDRARTPGAIATTNIAAICTPAYDERHGVVDKAVADIVFSRYGIAPSQRWRFAIDHLIATELGGSDDLRNLWPIPRTQLGHKQFVDGWLHEQVCSAALPLREAQRRERVDWRTAVDS